MMLLRGMSTHSRWEPGLLFVGLLIFYVACPVNTPFDSAWYLPTALSILKEGKVNIDEYAPTFHQGHGTIQVNGHWYNDYPLGPALVALPFVAAAELLFRGLAPFSALSPKIARWVDRWRYRSCATGEINLDFWNIPQRVIASILVSIAAVLMFLIASQSLSRPRALLLTLVFALGTSALSTATRALWQHGPSMLFLSLTLFCLLKSRVSPRRLLGAGLAIALAYIMRPTNAVSTLFVSVYVLIKYPRKWYWYLAGALIVAVPWTALNLSLYGNPLPPYYQPGRFELDARSFPNAAMANLFSPSRGLFLFTPVALFAIVGVGRKIVSHSFDSLDLLLVATVLAHWVVVSLFKVWWAGHSYGPRFLTDVLPYLFYLMIPAIGALTWDSIRGRIETVAFGLTAAISFAIHLYGAVSWGPHRWNGEPANVDLHPNRVWDWSDPQFLRGLRKAPTTSSLEESKRLKHASLLLPPRLQRDSADRGAFLEDIASHSRAVLDGIGRSLPSVVGVSHHLYCRTGRLGPVHQFGTLDVVNFDRQQFLAAGVPGGHPNRGDRESALRRIQISPEDHGAFARAWHLAALKELAAIGDPAIWVVRRSKPIRLVGRDHHLLGLM